MPWVATDRDDQTVYVYRDEPKMLGAYFTGGQFVVATDFPNPPAPGKKREFRWADVVAEPARRTPSTGLPPVCDGAADMKIDPPGSVAAPHEVVAVGGDGSEIVRTRPPVSTADFLPQDRPLPAIKLARMLNSMAITVSDLTFDEYPHDQRWRMLGSQLRQLAESIAHPLRLGEHG